jgi:hypothetical protein
MQKGHENLAKLKTDIKPRNLFNPHETIKSIGGWMNKCLILIWKQNAPWFVHGCNITKLEKRFEEALLNTPDSTFVSWDGASFDAH